MRLRTLLGFLCLATTAAAGSPAPAPTPTQSVPPGWKAAPPPAADAILWNGSDANVLVVTDKVKAELEAKPSYASLRIILRHGATEAHTAVLAAKLPWVTTLVTDEPTGLTSLTSIAKLRALKELHLNTNRITSLKPLAGHPALTGLTVSCSSDFTDVDLGALAAITTLERVELRQCGSITDFTGVEKLTKLTGFTSWSSPVTRLDPLAPLVNLKMLLVRGTRATDLAPIAQAVDLRILDISGMKPQSFAPLRSLGKLSALTVDDTSIPDLSVVTSPDLYSLSARDAKQLTTLAGLPAQPKLALLTLDGTGITSLDAIAKDKALSYLSIDRTAVVHIGVLNGLSNLKSVSLPPAVPDAEIIALQAAIPGIGVMRSGRPPPGFVPGPPIP